MASSLTLAFKRPLPRGTLYGDLVFRALGDQFEALDEIAWAIGARPLSQMMDGYADGDDPWFPAKNASMSIAALLSYLQNNPDSVPDCEAVMEDLRNVKKPLSEAAEDFIPFRFAMTS